MRHLIKIAHSIDTGPLLLELARQPRLWNRHRMRKDAPESPHVQMDDIWLRYNENLKKYEESGEFEGINDEHNSAFLPEWYALPAARPIVQGLMSRVFGTRLGGILITRIPPGGRIEPHVDASWHVTHYNTKVYVVLQTNPQCVNRVENEQVVMAPGDAWYFDNTLEHDVVNDGPDDRISLIVSIRCEK
jgi:hypothetical protein